MRKNNILPALIPALFLIFVSACNQNWHQQRLKELISQKTTYTYKNDSCDSTTVLLEHLFFNKDSIIIKSINYKDGYYYIADYNKKNRTLSKKFFSVDSNFLYGSISQLNKDKLETEVKFLDSLNRVTYKIMWQYKKNSSQLQKQTNNFSDGSVHDLVYRYDKFGNLLQYCNVVNGDTTINEFHNSTHNVSGQIVNDTIYYPGTRKIVFNNYKKDKLFYTIEKFELKSDSGSNYFPISKAYWKKYYLYDENGALFEIRNIKMYDGTNSFSLDSKEKFKYFTNGLIQQKTLINSENQKVFSITTDYKY